MQYEVSNTEAEQVPGSPGSQHQHPSGLPAQGYRGWSLCPGGCETSCCLGTPGLIPYCPPVTCVSGLCHS